MTKDKHQTVTQFQINYSSLHKTQTLTIMTTKM